MDAGSVMMKYRVEYQSTSADAEEVCFVVHTGGNTINKGLLP